MSYPVTFEADYVEQRSRLTAFFRLILAIPLAIWLYFYGIVASIALVIAWFAIVITGRYPQALYDFIAGFTRSLSRFTAYAALLSDHYPPFGSSDNPEYPVRMQLRRPARSIQPPEDLLSRDPRDSNRDPALRDEPAA